MYVSLVTDSCSGAQLSSRWWPAPFLCVHTAASWRGLRVSSRGRAYTHTHTCTRTCTSKHTYIHTYTHMHGHYTHVHTAASWRGLRVSSWGRAHTHTYTHIHAHTHTHKHAHAHTHTNKLTHTRTYIRIHIHIHINMITQIQLCFTCRYIPEKYALLPFILLKTMMMLSLTMMCPYACLSYACTYLRRKGTPRHTGNWERRHSKKGEGAYACWCVCMCM
jgi:hypothetical protein